MSRNRRANRLRSLTAAFLCVLTLSSFAVAPGYAVKQSDIDALKKEANSLTDQQKEIRDKIAALNNDKQKVVEKKDLLDQQAANTAAQIANIEAQIADYEALILQTEDEIHTAEVELAEAQAQEEDQYALFCRRVRAMEKQGTVNYWSVLFHSTSFSDLLSRLDIINEIMDADQRIIDQLKALQEETERKKERLEETKRSLEEIRAGLEESKTELEKQKAELDSQRREAESLIREINANAAEYQATLNAMEAEKDRLRREAQALQKKLEEEMQAKGQSYKTNPGGYIWPVDSKYVTSTVGGRSSPGGIGSTNHRGTDIGRVGYNSSVYASKAGTVIVSQNSSSYGNYIVISHGTGNTTLYAHLSSRKVKVGDKVKQGQVIGITGSTGHSTGPHLHFEVVEGGRLINPLNHGAQPRKGYLTGYTLSSNATGK